VGQFEARPRARACSELEVKRDVFRRGAHVAPLRDPRHDTSSMSVRGYGRRFSVSTSSTPSGFFFGCLSSDRGARRTRKRTAARHRVGRPVKKRRSRRRARRRRALRSSSTGFVTRMTTALMDRRWNSADAAILSPDSDGAVRASRDGRRSCSSNVLETMPFAWARRFHRSNPRGDESRRSRRSSSSARGGCGFNVSISSPRRRRRPRRRVRLPHPRRQAGRSSSAAQ